MNNSEVPAQNLESLADRIRKEAASLYKVAGDLRSWALMSAVQAVNVGKLMIEAKRQVGHGKFIAWLSLNVPDVPSRTLRRYMAMARDWPNLANSNSCYPAVAAFLSAGEKRSEVGPKPRQTRQSDLTQKTVKTGKNFLKKLEVIRQSSVRPADACLVEFRTVHERLGALLAAWDETSCADVVSKPNATTTKRKSGTVEATPQRG